MRWFETVSDYPMAVKFQSPADVTGLQFKFWQTLFQDMAHLL